MNRHRWLRLLALGLILLSVVGAATVVLNPLFNAKAAPNGPALAVNATAGIHAISSDIYGMNTYSVDPAFLKEVHIPVTRWGGDATTRYNWLVDSSNAGGDWYFMGGNGQNQVTIKPGASADQFVSANQQIGSKSLLTIPVIGYVNKSSAWNCSFPVSKYGAQQSVNPYVHPNGDNCGNGIDTHGKNIVDADPLANNIQVNPDWMRMWIQHLIATHGTAAKGGVQIYQMDNEPSGWGNTHRDVHPQPTGYDELVNDTIPYAAMIKATDPSAQVDGPGDFGYPAYIGMGRPGDNNTSHGIGMAEYYLQQMYAYQKQHGVRLLDYFDEHYYPASSDACIANCPAGDAKTQTERLQSTRSLWDPTYKDNSWIGQYYPPIQLIPMFHKWVNKDYPGTKTAITEYNFGGLESVNGALTEADVLGIFGRENLDLATLWGPRKATDPGAYAFRMYRNYDGKGSMFGNTSVQATSADQGKLAIYGALRSSDGALTLMIINKTANDLSSNLSLKGFNSAAKAQVYSYSSANTKAIVRRSDLAVSASGFQTTYAANSITLVALPRSGHRSTRPTPTPKGFNPAPKPTQPTGNNGPWSLIYSDDFNGTTLNPTWGLYDGPHNGGKSYYKPNEVWVSNGQAHIQIEQKETGGRPYTSGGMAAFKLAQTYGKYEFRARLPKGKGVGPYAILWENTPGHGDVEVDLFESPPAAKDKVYFTNHGNGQPSQITATGNFGDAFHTFSYEWSPNKLVFSIDGVQKGVITKNVPNFAMWLGIAVSSGDAFTGTPDGSTKLPVTLDVDWVHIYKYTGK
jgi:beta-glucanase (GH16 family)